MVANDLLLELEEMQNMSRKLQCMQNKLLQCKKNASKRPKTKSRLGRKSRSYNTIWRTMRRKSDAETFQEARLEEEFEKLKAGEGKHGSNASQSSVGAAWIQPSCKTSSQLERTKPGSSWCSFNVNSTGGMDRNIKRHQSYWCTLPKNNHTKKEQDAVGALPL